MPGLTTGSHNPRSKANCAPTPQPRIGAAPPSATKRVGIQAAAIPIAKASSSTVTRPISGQGGGFSWITSPVSIVSMMLARRSVPGTGVLLNGAGLLSAMPINEAPISTMRSLKV